MERILADEQRQMFNTELGQMNKLSQNTTH